MADIGKKENSKRLHSLINEIIKAEWEFCPARTTILGIHDYDDTLGDMSRSSMSRFAGIFKTKLESLQTIVDPVLLTPDERVDYYSAMSLAHSNYAMLDMYRQWETDPSLYLKVAVWGCYIFLLRDFAPLEDRMNSMLKRMREIPEMLETAKSNISHPALEFVQFAIEMAGSTAEFFRTAIPHFADKVPTLRSEILSENENVVKAIEDYSKYLKKNVIPKADGCFAMGDTTYRYLLKNEHYLPYEPKELLRIGEAILNDTLDHISEVAAQIDSSTSWNQLVARLKDDHPDKDTLLETYWLAMHSAKRFVIERDLATIPFDDDLVFCETPEFERNTIPYAAYFPSGPFESNDSGGFWITPVDPNASTQEIILQLRGHCVHTIPIIALHEGYPGHHLQLTRTKKIDSPIRKEMMSSLFMEGWALYCEQMMHEQGYYTDLRVRLFQLIDLLWRACRVIIDVGLHTQNMSIEDAVDMLVEISHLDRMSAALEVRRYTMTPMQPMTYVIGMIQILDLRERVKAKLGGKFNLKTFHDRILDQGAIPTPLISQAFIGDSITPESQTSSNRTSDIFLDSEYYQLAEQILFSTPANDVSKNLGRTCITDQ